MRVCYSGPEGTAGVGRCLEGTSACTADGSGFANACEGEITPAEEDCASPFDDDCDGEINEGCACEPGAIAACYSGPANTVEVGICSAGTQTCAADGLSFDACAGETLPLAEDCATSEDDDCDGEANETEAGCLCAPGESQSCYSGPSGTLGVGICMAGEQVCDEDGQGWGPCTGETLPASEDCAQEFDEDCDGSVNEGSAGCVCEPGTIAACYSGPAGTLGVGLCSGGEQTCDGNGLGFGPCSGEVLPATETCNTSGDDDCDGATNEEGAGCVCVPGSSAACYSGPAGTAGVGVCSTGLQTCEPSGLAYGACIGEVVPIPEDCNTPLDENCDGTVNETTSGCACPGENVQTLVSENCDTDYGETLWRVELPERAGASIAGADGSVTLVLRVTPATPPGYVGLPEPGPAPGIMVARYDADGSLVWGNEGVGIVYPDLSPTAYELGVAPNGFTAVALPGFGSGWHALGSYPYFTMPSNTFRALYSIAPDGVPLFGVAAPRFISLEDHLTVHAVASTSDGGLYYASTYYAYHLVRYDSAGAIAWQKDDTSFYSEHVSLDGLPDGGVVVAMRAGSQTFDLGGGPLVPAGAPQTGDLVVARYDVSGGLAWAVRPIDVDDVLNVRVEGSTIGVATGHGLVRLSLANGALISNEIVPQYSGVGVRPYALMGASGLLFGDIYSGARDFGLGPLAPYNGTSGFMFAIREPGATRWARAPLMSSWFTTLAAWPGYLYGATYLQGTVDTDGALETLPSPKPFLYRLAY